MQSAEILTHPSFEPNDNPLDTYVRQYCLNIFSGEGGQKLYITPKASLWMTDHIVDYVARPMDAITREMMIGKIIHSLHVVKCIVTLAESMPHHSWDLPQVALAGIGHDRARFDQAYNQATFKEKADSPRHAHAGAEMMEIALLPITPASRRAIVHAIDKHSDKTYDGEEWLARLLQDADKYVLLGEFAQIGDIDSNSYLNLPPTRGLPVPLQDEGNAYSDFFAGRLVDSKYVRTQGDVILRYLSWIYGFHFLETKRMLASTNILETVAEKLIPYEQNDPLVREYLPKILETIRNWKEEVLQAA